MKEKKEILKQIRDLEKAIKKIEDRVENGQKISDPQFYVQMEESKNDLQVKLENKKIELRTLVAQGETQQAVQEYN